MKNLILALIFSSFHLILFSQSQQTNCQRIDKVQGVLNAFHVQPLSIDANIREEIITLFLAEIDAEGFVFSLEQGNQMRKKANLDGLCLAFESIEFHYKKGFATYDSLAKLILSKPIQYKPSETISFPAASDGRKEYSKLELEDRIKKYFKYLVLNRMVFGLTRDSKLDSLTYAKEKEEKVRVDIQKSITEELEWIQDNREDVNAFLLENFLNAIALRYDPHSNYFSFEQNKQFEQELSAEQTIFGISYLENKDKELEISNILPGSAAWNSNEINEGDVLEAIQKKKGEKLDLKGKGPKTLNKFFSELTSDEVTFYVRKKTGETKKIELVRTKVENKENSFRGYVLHDDSLRLGYIALPSFYTDMEHETDLGCANDVAKEILLLKKDSIKGLILDLRDNGGGSMKEAAELAGLFIDQGPVAIYDDKKTKPTLLKDMNRGTVYDGPLIVLVNSTSASASEFFAGAMKDYKRAIIVGTATFGKGTAQSVFPVDTVTQQPEEGFLKITIGKFYSVSSASNQEVGVQPDILLKDAYSEVDYFAERNQKYHLKNDRTVKKVTYTPNTRFVNTQTLDDAKKRISSNPTLIQLQENALKIKTLTEGIETIPLDFEGFKKFKKMKIQTLEDLKKLNSSKLLTITNHSFSTKMDGYNANEKKFNEEIIENLEKDLQLQECLYILKDLLIFAAH